VQQAIQSYLSAIEANLKGGDATEHSYRPAFKQLLDEITGLEAINEPKQSKCGAPDFVLKDGLLPVGHIECKDVGIDLNKVEKSVQLKRYLPALPNLILTDYLEFRWFVDGKKQLTLTIATWNGSNLIANKAGVSQLVTLFRQFAETRTKTIRTARQLATLLARKAQLLDSLVVQTFENEAEAGELHEQFRSIKEMLVPDMSEAAFADMYAQTIAYGLFAARIFDPTPENFTRMEAASLLPPTNPLLRAFFKHLGSYDFDNDPAVAWCIDEMCALFLHADIHKILEDFSRKKGFEDPIVHFYETFLAEYNPKLRKSRGVYYTPEPVVSFIVRSVDTILKNKFDKPKGLADQSVYVLDPATGTATFLRAVIEMVHRYFVEKGQAGMWDAYVPEYVLKRIFGFELLMAPYSIAHLKLGQQLRETGYKFESGERLGIYLTNTLEEAAKKSESLLGLAKLISDEGDAASHIKRDEPVMVVLGNPPYAGHSANKGEWISRMMQDYYQVDGQPLGEKNPKWLQDDYVKFLRFAQWRIEQTGHGIVAMITNHGYLDNPTFRGMRQSLMNTFDEIYVLDLHGNTKKKEKAPDGGEDKNVFDIQQGVSICMMVKYAQPKEKTSVFHAHLWGKRDVKYTALDEEDISSIAWTETEPESPYYLFIPQNKGLWDEYQQGWSLPDVFPVNVLGFQTHRDHFAIAFTSEEMEQRTSDMRNSFISDIELRQKYNLKDNRDWKLSEARQQARNTSHKEVVLDCQYRPFDVRPSYFSYEAMDYPRRELIDHVAGRRNLCLNVCRQTKASEWRHAVVSDKPTPAVYVEIKDGSNVMPLYVYPSDNGAQGDLLATKKKKPNFTPEFVESLSERLGLTFDPAAHRGIHTGVIASEAKQSHGDRHGASPLAMTEAWNPEDLFCYAYAVFHSPTYRNRYAEFLKIDFPRLPLISDKGLFFKLAELGEELVLLHLMRSPKLNDFITSFPHSGSNIVEKVMFRHCEPEAKQSGDCHVAPCGAPRNDGNVVIGNVWFNKNQCFEGVEEEDWNFHIGGYQVLAKWLKDRKGRPLSFDDIEHYQKIVVAIHETRRLMAEIDAAIPAWPME